MRRPSSGWEHRWPSPRSQHVPALPSRCRHGNPAQAQAEVGFPLTQQCSPLRLPPGHPPPEAHFHTQPSQEHCLGRRHGAGRGTKGRGDVLVGMQGEGKAAPELESSPGSALKARAGWILSPPRHLSLLSKHLSRWLCTSPRLTWGSTEPAQLGARSWGPQLPQKSPPELLPSAQPLPARFKAEGLIHPVSFCKRFSGD